MIPVIDVIILSIDIVVVGLIVLVSLYRLIKWAFIGTSITLLHEDTIHIASGCTIQIAARIKQRPKCNFQLDWQKIGSNNEARNISFCETIKYSGTLVQSFEPMLFINKAEKEDAGLYQLRYKSSTEVVISRQVAVHVFGDTTGNSISEGENSFLRYYSLCRLGRDCVLQFFRHHVKEANLQNHLNPHKPFLQRICTKLEVDVLYPKTGCVRSSDFDFCLLYKLVRNTLVGVSPPKDGWSFEPKSGSTSKSDDIERIRSHRNFLSHTTKYALPKLKFKTKWKDLAKAINRLSNGVLSNDVQSLLQRTFYKHHQHEYIQILRDNMREIQEEVGTCRRSVSDMQDRVLNLEDNVDSVKQDLSNIEKRFPDHHIPPHIKRSHREIIENWGKNNRLFFKDTQGFHQALDMVQSRNVVVIIGGPGSGKTVTARCIALQLQEEEWEIVPVFTPDDIMHCRNTERQQVFLLDDFVGTFALNMSLYDNIVKYKAPIFESQEQNTKILLTCRKSVYNAAIQLKELCCLSVIDLESNENRLNNEEKRKILRKHCEAMSVPQKHYENLSFENVNIMFPILCNLFACNEDYQAIGERFFRRPFEGLCKEFDIMQKRNTEYYAALIFCMISGNKLPMHSLPENEIKACVYDSCGLNRGTSDRTVLDALEQMVGTYVTRIDACYSLIHDSLFDILAYHYGRCVKDFPDIIKYFPSNFISNRLCVDSNQAEDEFSIQTPEDQFELLAERLYRDLQDLKFYEVFRTKALFNEHFTQTFIEILKRKPYDILNKVFLLLQNNISCEKPNDIEETEHYLLTDLFILDDQNERCGIRAISWVVYFGHLQLLEYIMDRVHAVEGSYQAVFGYEKMEQTRLLVLCCYKKDEIMTRLLLQNLSHNIINENLFSLNMSKSIQNTHRYYTPLSAACQSGSLPIVKLLVFNGAKIDENDPNKMSPLSVAYNYGHIQIVNFLLNRKGLYQNRTCIIFDTEDKKYVRIITYKHDEWPILNEEYKLKEEKVSDTKYSELGQMKLSRKQINAFRESSEIVFYNPIHPHATRQKVLVGMYQLPKRGICNKSQLIFRRIGNRFIATKTTENEIAMFQIDKNGKLRCLKQVLQRSKNDRKIQRADMEKTLLSGSFMTNFSV